MEKGRTDVKIGAGGGSFLRVVVGVVRTKGRGDWMEKDTNKQEKNICGYSK